MPTNFLWRLEAHSNLYSAPVGAPAYHADFPISIAPPTWWRIIIFKSRVGAATDYVNLSIYKALVGAATYRFGLCYLYSNPVGAPLSFPFPIFRQFLTTVNLYGTSVGVTTLCQFLMLRHFFLTVNFYSASVGTAILCQFPNLYSTPAGALASFRFP